MAPPAEPQPPRRDQLGSEWVTASRRLLAPRYGAGNTLSTGRGIAGWRAGREAPNVTSDPQLPREDNAAVLRGHLGETTTAKAASSRTLRTRPGSSPSAAVWCSNASQVSSGSSRTGNP